MVIVDPGCLTSKAGVGDRTERHQAKSSSTENQGVLMRSPPFLPSFLVQVPKGCLGTKMKV